MARLTERLEIGLVTASFAKAFAVAGNALAFIVAICV